MGEDKATKRLRALIERPERCSFWGQEYTITPRLISQVFGDGSHLICVTPLATRPNYFVVRVGSEPEFDVRDILDEIMLSADEDYGVFGDEDALDSDGDDPRPFPVADWGVGCCWGERFPVAEWRPTPRGRRGYAGLQPRKGKK